MKYFFMALVLVLTGLLTACPTATSTNQAPTVTSPGDQTNTVGDSINLTVTATDPDGDTLRFSATGLPDGLSMSNGGAISGSLTTAGDFAVQVSVSDANGHTPSVSFAWKVNAKPEPTDTQPPTIISTSSTGNTSVEVVFSEAVKGADNPANYSVLSDLNVTAASVAADQQTVMLTTSAQTENTSYALLVSQGVTDLAGNPYKAGNDEQFATTFFGTAPAALEPPDFKVSIASSFADEPSLVVGVVDLQVTDLEKLEYRLERFSSSCSDAAEVAKTATISSPSSAFAFELPTTYYGAFKLSLTATYKASAFQNNVKTILSEPFFPESVNDPEALDVAGLVFVEVLDNYSVFDNLKQADLRTIKTGIVGETEEAFSFEVFVDLQAPSDANVAFVSYNLRGIETADRKWCDSSGTEFIVSGGKTELLGQEPNEAFNKPTAEGGGPNTPFGFDIKPEPLIVEGAGTRRLFTLYQVELDEGFFAKDDPETLKTAPRQTFEFLVMDCLSEEFPEGISCADFNDIGR
ncbi:MAG: Ig-like domain-containing protein [Trueperaceae bacterium]|nr:Ig-like domain-containing protein [Trueperaceae bacterium]